LPHEKSRLSLPLARGRRWFLFRGSSPGKAADTAAWQLLAGGIVAVCGVVVGLWQPKAN
jgi:hypothetical protein